MFFVYYYIKDLIVFSGERERVSGVPWRDRADFFGKGRIEDTSGGKPAELYQLVSRVFLLSQKEFCILHPTPVYQCLKVALEVMIHDIREVGSIRAGCKKKILRWLSAVLEKEKQFGIYLLFYIGSI